VMKTVLSPNWAMASFRKGSASLQSGHQDSEGEFGFVEIV
jgi:hypothetical protein